MSPGFCSEFYLGLQSILAADGDHEYLPLNSSGDEEAGVLYKFLDESDEKERPKEPLGEHTDPAVCQCRSNGFRDTCTDCSRTPEQLHRSFEEEKLRASFSRYDKQAEASTCAGDPPHREMVSRFHRLKTIRHPHLCVYTNVLRIKRRIYCVSEHWSLSLQDIMEAWDHEANTQNGQCATTSSTEAGAEEAVPAQSTSRWDVKKLEFLSAVVTQTLSALAHLNSMGLAHNRLEPRTIRIDAHGNVRLSEWGLSYLTDGGRLAPSADLLAPFDYLAPEQVLAGPDVMRQARSCSKHDVWALGIILLKILQPDCSIEAPLSQVKPLENERIAVHGFSASTKSSNSLPHSPKDQEIPETVGGEENKDLDSLRKEMKSITQLVLYCALGVDCKVLIPLDPPNNETQLDCGSSLVAPTVSAVGTALARWLMHHMPLLEKMMQKAVGKPCFMLSSERLATALTALATPRDPHALKIDSAQPATLNQQDVLRVGQGVPEASTVTASTPADDVKTALFRRCLGAFTQWLSGSLLCKRQHFSILWGCEKEACAESGATALQSKNSDGNPCTMGVAFGEAQTDVERMIQDVRELVRACLILHPSSRPAPCDLLAFNWLQKAQLDRQLWCSRGSECIGTIAELHVDEELRRVFADMQEQPEAPSDSTAPRGVPWLPYSRSESTNSLDRLLRNHNIGIDEIFYWWQLQGGDVHSALLSQGAFQPVPPVFSLPLCCLRLQQAKKERSVSISESSCLTRVEFLAAFADCWVHDASKRESSCSCLSHKKAADSCILSPAENSLNPSIPVECEQKATKNQQERPSDAQDVSGIATSHDIWRLAATEAEDSFFLTGFTGDRKWTDVRLWKEGDVRVFGVSVEEALKAIQEADRFPVTQMSEVRPPCLYRRQCHFLYQRLRVRLFKSLLAQLPKSRHRLMEEAACDIPPLLRSEVWAAVMGVNLVGVLHTTQFAYEEAASSLGCLALEALQTSEFSQYHEYHDLLGSEEGRRRLVTLVGVVLQRNPMYVCVRGMDALAAPLLLLYYDQENVALACLEKLLQDFQQHLFAAESASYLRRQLAASNRLLLFVDPELALHMHRLGLHSDMYALSWHLTLFSHVLPLQQLLLLWDSLLLQPPTFVHFLTVCILHFLRVPLLSLSPDEESTAIRLLQASFEFVNIPAFCAAAVALQNAVPWSLVLLPSPSKSPIVSGDTPVGNFSNGKQHGGLLTEGRNEPDAAKQEMTEGAGEISANSQSPDHGAEYEASELSQRSPEAQQFFIGDGESCSRSPSDSPRTDPKSDVGDVHVNTLPSRVGRFTATPSGKQLTSKQNASWKTRAIMSVMKGPAMMLLGAPRKPSTARALHAEVEGEASSYADPMEALYSSESLAPRWWDKISEKEFLQATSSVWDEGVGAEELNEAGLDTEQALQPPCIGVDVLLQFHEESVVLDIRPRPAFESLHFTNAVHITPKDVDELICLLREGQLTLPEPKGVLQQMQRFGTSRQRVVKMTRSSASSSLDTFHAASDSATAMGLAPPEVQEAAQARGFQAPTTAAAQPWMSPTMHRLPLVVVVGDKEDSGSGLARRLLLAGVSCVCVVMGGIEALQFDAPYDFLTGKYVK